MARRDFEEHAIVVTMIPGDQGTHIALYRPNGELAAEQRIEYDSDTLLWLYLIEKMQNDF